MLISTAVAKGFLDHVYFVHPLTLERYIGRHIDQCMGRYNDRDMLVDVLTDGINRDISHVKVDISTDYRQISRSI